MRDKINNTKMQKTLNRQLSDNCPIDLSIIILTWNSQYYLKNCIESILDAAGNFRYEIIVIDNNSKDRTKKILRQLRSEHKIIFVQNEKNKGVAKGRNQGITLAKGKFIMFLDVDTIVLPMAIEKLINYMNQNIQCGIAAPMLLSPDGRLRFSCQEFPTVLTKVFRRIPLKSAKKFLAQSELHEWHHRDTIAIDWVIGACQMIRRSAINKVGTLDENFFYGAEDIDYCMRIWQAGFQVVYHPESVVIHYEQRVTKKQLLSKLSFHHLIGICYFFFKHRYMFSNRSITGRRQKGGWVRHRHGDPI